MPSRASFEWNGDKILERVTEAARKGVDDTTQATDDVATASHWWANRTGNLERNIVTEPAVVEGSRVVGKVGATTMRKGKRTGWYGLFLEYKLPWLRPAADETFPTLATRIRERLK